MKRRNLILASSGLLGIPAWAAKPCPPPIVSAPSGDVASPICPVPAQGASALASLAASMAPGTWAKLTVANQNALLGVGGVSGTMIHFSNSMPWNPVDKVIDIIGMDHNWPAGLRHVRYDPPSNSFILNSEGGIDGTNIAHGYDHNSVNPTTGDVYHRVYGGFSGSVPVRKRARGGNAWSSIPAGKAGDQVAMGTCWWSGAFNGGGAQGQLMVFCTGAASGAATDGEMIAYNPLTNSWFLGGNGYAPNYGAGATYHSVMEYSTAKNLAVYGGGNVAPNKLWKLNADGTHGSLTDVPAGKAVGIQRGLLTEDPVTGNFLLLSAGQLWELNPGGSGTWTQQTGSRTPPSDVGIPGPSTIVATICSAIPELGVVAYITQPSQANGTFFLYKHA